MTDTIPNTTPPLTPHAEPPREVVLPGGGTNGISVVGALHALHQRGLLAHVRRWIGGSAGATTALFMVLGYTPKVLYEILRRLDFASFNDISCDSILGCYDTMGLTDGKHIMSIVRAALVKKGFSEATTFRELAASYPKRSLVVTGYNLSQGKTVAFSVETTPDMVVWLACRISVSVPFLFRPVVFDGDLYTDGCCLENVPLRFATHKRRVLVLKTTSVQPTDFLAGTPSTCPNPSSLLEFFALFQKRVYHVLDRQVLHRQCKRRPHTLLIIQVPSTIGNHFVVNFAMDEAGKERLFRLGVGAGMGWGAEMGDGDGGEGGDRDGVAGSTHHNT